MKEKFTLFDIPQLQLACGASTSRNDLLLKFLNGFEFESVYDTEDDSRVFSAGGKHEIHIEIFNFDKPLSRFLEISYFENGQFVIL